MPDWLLQGITIAICSGAIIGIFNCLKNIIIKFFKSGFYKTKIFDFYLYLIGFICSYSLFLLKTFNNKILIAINLISGLLNLYALCSTFCEYYYKQK